MMELVNKAIIFAAKAHDGMRRKQENTPYILHPMEAAVIIASMTDDQNVIAAGALHDVVEDAGISIEEVAENFGKRVAELVASETENKRTELPPGSTWQVRKQEAIQALRETTDIDVKMLYLGDKLANMRSIHSSWKKQGNAMWQHFNQKDPAAQAWYYRSILDCIRELSDTEAYNEFDRLVETVFREA